MAVEARLLGPLEVVGDDGRGASLPGPKLRALATLMALEAGSVVSSDRLIDVLYGEELPAKPVNALHLLVSKFRRALGGIEEGGERLVVTHSTGYVLDIDRERVDIYRFERLATEGRRLLEEQPDQAVARLREALVLWRGDALVDLTYREMASVERVRLEELRLDAIEDRIDAELALGAHADVVSELEQLTATYPLRERLWGQLMVARYRCGRQGDALRAYQTARQQLAHELGLEPGPELRRLEAAVLAQDPTLVAPRQPKPAAGRAGNLPLALTELIGRKEEVRDVRVLVGIHRLVTVVGPGGAGKTRLATEVGWELTEEIADGVWMVELASVDGAGVVPTVAGVLGADHNGGDVAGLARSLSDREVLLVLDNCEHVVDESARLVHELLSHAPKVRVLATSREVLGVPGEHRFPLPPLGMDAAVELLAERVESAGGPPLLADATGRHHAFEICARLDGLPLAVELAASRVAQLDAADVLSRLDDRFRLLTGGLRTADPRQQTLRAVVDWSWELLDEKEQLVFRRFSTFAGTACLDAAEQVCAGDGVAVADVAPLLARLAEKSLVTLDRTASPPRFGMLQTLMDYGGQRLAESGEEETVRRRHAGWAARLAAGAEAGLRCGSQVLFLGRLSAELDNLRAASSWATTHDPSLALGLAVNLGWFCYMTNQAETGWELLSAALHATSETGAHEVAAPSPVRPLGLAFAASLGKMSGHLDEAASIGLEAEAALSGEVPVGVAGRTLSILALADVQAGTIESARSWLERARTCFRSPEDDWWLGYVDLAQAVIALFEGRARDCLELVDRSVEVMRALGDEWVALLALLPRAYVAERQGQLDEAAAALEQGLLGAAAFGSAIASSPVRLPMLSIARARLALIRSAQARHREAVPLADQALDEAGLGTNSAVAIALQARGRALVGLGQRAEGRDDLERAARVFQDLGVGVAVAECLVDVGRSWLADHDPTTAVARLEQARSEALRTEDRHTTVVTLRALADAYAAAGDPAAALAARTETEERSG